MCSLFYFKGSSQSLRISTSMWLAMRLGFPCVAFARGLWTGQLWMLSTISRASTFLTPSPIPVPTATRWLLPEKRCKGIFRSVKFLLFECINIGHWSTGVFYVTELWEAWLHFPGVIKKPEDFDSFIRLNEYGVPSCAVCYAFSHSAKSNVRNHIESKHFPNTFTYNCPICAKILASKKSLQNHASKCKMTLQ